MNEKLRKKFNISKLLPKTGKASSIPGTVKYVGQERETPVNLHIIDYSDTGFTEKDIENVSQCLPFKESPTVTWLNISGVHDERIISQLGGDFNIHPLVLEDIANTTQRPKIEEYDDYIFVIIKMVYIPEESGEVIIEQVSLLIGKDYVVSFQEKEGDILEGLRERIRNHKGRIRKLGSDYLLYAIIDSVVDHYYSVLEYLGEEIEKIETRLRSTASQELLNKIYDLKQELIFVRKSIWPMRDLISGLVHLEHELLSDTTTVYLRDVYDHTIQVAETVDTFRDMASSMLDLYLSTVSNKTNEVMKVLTIFAAIFIPLTFIAGVYGMNFEFMPELNKHLAYPLWWAGILIITSVMLIFFKRKKWL